MKNMTVMMRACVCGVLGGNNPCAHVQISNSCEWGVRNSILHNTTPIHYNYTSSINTQGRTVHSLHFISLKMRLADLHMCTESLLNVRQ